MGLTWFRRQHEAELAVCCMGNHFLDFSIGIASVTVKWFSIFVSCNGKSG